MATFQQREGGRWQAKIRRNGVTKSETFSTRADAEAWARKNESEIERGLWRDSTEAETTTLRAALDRYEREKTAAKKGAAQEKSVLAVLRDEPLSKKPLAHIRGADVAAMRDKWLSAVSPSTVARRLVVLGHVFTVACKEWGMETLQNPVTKIQRPKVDDARSRRVDESEMAAICSVTRSRWLPAIARLAVETAMRRGELVALRWEHVDLKKRVAHLPETKNGHARDVPLSSAAVAVLQTMPRNINGGVFDVREDAVTQAFERACRRAGIEGLRFHDLRHEATSRLAERLQMHELMRVTGHKDTRMLARYYHPRAEDLARKLG